MSETMATETVVLDHEEGLHLRPASLLAKVADSFSSQISLVYENQRVDAKSVMEMLTLGATHGANLVVEARGEDAQQAVEAILQLVKCDFADPSETP